jgi:hypothetical protein
VLLDEDKVLRKMDGNLEHMMLQLEDYPIFGDLPLVRQHLWLTFCGLAILTLGRKNHNKGLINRGYVIMKELWKLNQIGSANAQPVYMRLRAVDTHKCGAWTSRGPEE